VTGTLIDTMPVVLDVVGIMVWLDENWSGVLSADDVLSLSARVGRNGAPELLHELSVWGYLDDGASCRDLHRLGAGGVAAGTPSPRRLELWESVGHVGERTVRRSAEGPTDLVLRRSPARLVLDR
jgi:hypothetical protein